MSSAKIWRYISVMEDNDIDMFALVSGIIEHREAGDESITEANVSLMGDSANIIRLISAQYATEDLRSQLIESTLQVLKDDEEKAAHLIKRISAQNNQEIVRDQLVKSTIRAVKDDIPSVIKLQKQLVDHASSPALIDCIHTFSMLNYRDEMKQLVAKETGFHFNALHSRPDQMNDFRIQEMLDRMKSVAPRLNELLGVLLDARGGVRRISDSDVEPEQGSTHDEEDSTVIKLGPIQTSITRCPCFI